jgi:photosystem II stability/assembly factor-like uncharacterized protein
MKTFLSILFFFCLLSLAIFPQPWQLQIANVPTDAIVAPFSPVNDNICWASWSTGWVSSPYINGYCRTTDGGATWVCDTIPETENGSIWWIEALDANTAYIAVETWAASGMQGIYKTTDGGATWQKYPNAYTNSPLGPGYIHFFDINNGVVVGEVDPNTSCLEIYTTTNGGTDWNLVPPSNIPPSITVEYLQPVEVAEFGDFIWLPTVSSNGPRFYKTTDKGYTWTLIELPGTNQDYVMFAAFQNESIGIRVVWTYTPSYAILEKTTDGGNTWNEIPGPYAGCIPVNVCYVPGTASAYVITGDVNVNGYAGGSAYTLDGGDTWTALDNGNYSYTIFNSYNIGWATQFYTNNFYKYIGPPPLPVELTSFTATANGSEVALNWSTASEINNLGFEIQRSFEGNDFVTVGVVYGKGTTTERQDYSYSDKNLADGKYSYRLKQIDFNGSYKYSDVIEVEFRVFNSYLLEQNYPNPFNPATTIGFGVQEKSNVKITILNSIGEEVAVVLNEEKEPGYHQIEFNAANLPSGVYLYRIEAGNYINTKKMILLK